MNYERGKLMKKLLVVILVVLLAGCVTTGDLSTFHQGESGDYKYQGPVDPIVISRWEVVNYIMWGPAVESFHMPPKNHKNIQVASLVTLQNGGIYAYSLYFTDGTVEVYEIIDEDGSYHRTTDRVTERQMDIFIKGFKLSLRTWEVRQERLKQESRAKGV